MIVLILKFRVANFNHPVLHSKRHSNIPYIFVEYRLGLRCKTMVICEYFCLLNFLFIDLQVVAQFV